MAFDFETTLDRRGTCSAKWDGLEKKFGVADASDMISMWIADMDFACPPEIVAAVQKRVAHPVYGYRFAPEETQQAICHWQKKRFDLDIAPDAILFGSGVLSVVDSAIQAMTKPGDGIIIQPPVYYPFANGIRQCQRTVVESPLIEREIDGRLQYTLDLDGLRTLAAREDVTAMILCNPHNPAGRIWTPEEQRLVAQICRDNGLFLIVDEIHADLAIGKHRMVPFMKACPDCAGFALSVTSTSKSFNVAGLGAAYGLAPDKAVREKVGEWLKRTHTGGLGYLGADAIIAAYESCDYYVDGLRQKLEENAELVYAFCRERLPQVRVADLQGTYLMWLDFTRLGIPKEKIERFLLDEAGLIFDPGHWFSERYEGYGRMNIATSTATVRAAMEKLEKAVKTHREG